MKDFPIRSILPPKGGELDSLRIFSISEVLSGEDMIQDLHRHDFYFILLVYRGIGIHEIDFVEYPITDKSISIMRPGQVHRLELKAGSEGYWLAFNNDFQPLSSTRNKGLLRGIARRSLYKPGEKNIDVLCACFKSMLDEYRSGEIGFEEVIKATFDVLLIQLLRSQQNDQDASVTAGQYQQEKLQEFLDLLEANIRTKKQVAAYAEMMNLSSFQLNSITKSLVGKKVAELIEDQILLEAKRYLLGTPNQVAQIASQLGYEDISYFIRFFRKRIGVTPEAFRKNFR